MSSNNTDLLINFKVTKILDIDQVTKTANLFGHYNNESYILLLQKQSFYKEDSFDFNDLSDLLLIGKNDIYSWFSFKCNSFNQFKITAIRNPSELHIVKYSEQEKFYIEESKDFYKAKISPYIGSLPKKRIEWVHNILSGKSKETLIYNNQNEHTGFIVLPDLKWTQKSVSDLYCLVMLRSNGIKSLRDVDSENVNLLEEVKEKTTKHICEKYKLNRNKLVMFVHYPPSYYHFHVHCMNIENKMFRQSGSSDRAHSLTSIIQNAKIKNNYYKECNLSYSVGRNEPIYQLFNEYQQEMDTQRTKNKEPN